MSRPELHFQPTSHLQTLRMYYKFRLSLLKNQQKHHTNGTKDRQVDFTSVGLRPSSLRSSQTEGGGSLVVVVYCVVPLILSTRRTFVPWSRQTLRRTVLRRVGSEPIDTIDFLNRDVTLRGLDTILIPPSYERLKELNHL